MVQITQKKAAFAALKKSFLKMAFLFGGALFAVMIVFSSCTARV